MREPLPPGRRPQRMGCDHGRGAAMGHATAPWLAGLNASESTYKEYIVVIIISETYFNLFFNQKDEIPQRHKNTSHKIRSTQYYNKLEILK